MTETCDMPPGRELDAIVAQRLAGWLWLARMGSKWLGPPSMLGETDPRIGTIRKADESDTPEDPWWLHDEQSWPDLPIVPHYTTDIAAAWPLAERLGMRLGPYDHESWYAEKFVPFKHTTTMVGRTAAHAICLLALDLVNENPRLAPELGGVLAYVAGPGRNQPQ